MESPIFTYIINLEKRLDRRHYIKKEFSDRSEFKTHLVKAKQDINPAVGLYKSVHSIVLEAKRKNLPFVLICEDDHKFTSQYSRRNIISYIKRVQALNADVFLGGVSWFSCGIQVDENLYWVEKFNGTQFLIIFSAFYPKVLETQFKDDDILDLWLANLSDQIFVAVPMLSLQQDFGYSDVTPKNNGRGTVEEFFVNTIARWSAVNNIYEHVYNTHLIELLSDSECETIQLPTYVIALGRNNDELNQALQEFCEKTEFDTEVIHTLGNENTAIKYWNSVKNVVNLAKERGEEVILISTCDHTFSDSYNKKVLFSSIYQGALLGADIILGSSCRTQQVIPVNEYLCWVDRFESSQFTIIYSRFFDIILNEELDQFVSPDRKLSTMTSNKYLLHPFVSRNDESNLSGSLQSKFTYHNCEQRISHLRKKSKQFSNFNNWEI